MKNPYTIFALKTPNLALKNQNILNKVHDQTNQIGVLMYFTAFTRAVDEVHIALVVMLSC